MEEKKKQILIVDDDEFHISFAEIYLNEKYDVIPATSGQIALEYLQKSLKDDTLPDLILLDIIMPKMDGFETYNQIRAISSSKEIPVVFLTSVYEKEKEQHALDIGAADYITKPYNKEDLLSRLEKILVPSV